MHRRLRKEALALQKSVFAAKKTTAELNVLLDDILTMVDGSVDDIRSYPIHRLSDIWSLGQQNTAVENLTLAKPGKRKKSTNSAIKKQRWFARLFSATPARGNRSNHDSDSR